MLTLSLMLGLLLLMKSIDRARSPLSILGLELLSGSLSSDILVIVTLIRGRHGAVLYSGLLLNAWLILHEATIQLHAILAVRGLLSNIWQGQSLWDVVLWGELRLSMCRRRRHSGRCRLCWRRRVRLGVPRELGHIQLGQFPLPSLDVKPC